MKSFHTGQFIDAIRCQPCLYKQSHPDYKDPAKKILIWNDIAQQFHIISGEAAKAKWRNVRDSYVKHLKSLKMGNPKRKYNSWPWSDNMEFLIPYVTGRSDSLLDADHQVFVKQENVWDDGNLLPQPEDSIHSESIHAEDHQQVDENLMATTLCTPDYVEAIKVEVSDPTDLMMLSHARRIRGFSRKRQIQVEMKISQLVMEAEMEQLAESESPTTSSQQ